MEEDLSIGPDNGKPEYLFSQIGGLAVDDEGNIYAIDIPRSGGPGLR